MPQPGWGRVVAALVVCCCLAVLAAGFLSAQGGSPELKGSDAAVEEALDNDTDRSVVGPRRNVTVVTADSTAMLGDGGDGARVGSEVVAFAPNGSIYYVNSTWSRYWDVDPVEGTSATVEYVYSQHRPPMACPGPDDCTQNGVERVNLTTGETTAVFARHTPGIPATRWHDVDRIDEHRLLVADIDEDRAFIVNATTGETTWEWRARTAFDTASGGPYPEDWTHINDVEYVELGGRETVMVSVRNQDRVVFVDVENGLRENWTLGNGDHHTLYEQHNPDYIPPARGGPAVVVADSENGRVVEYQRRNGSWEQSWAWRDPRLTWPRDADRLPNGHTLITDSNGDRVVEVDENGTVVWSTTLGFPYEAERLGTGDESAGGPSAATAGLSTVRPNASNRSAVSDAAAAAPPTLVNAVAYAIPGWVGPTELVAAVALALVVPVWAAVECRRALTRSATWPVLRRDS